MSLKEKEISSKPIFKGRLIDRSDREEKISGA